MFLVFHAFILTQPAGCRLVRLPGCGGIADVTRIPVGYPIKIPRELVRREYLPPGDLARIGTLAMQRHDWRLARRAMPYARKLRPKDPAIEKAYRNYLKQRRLARRRNRATRSMKRVAKQ